jgi:hypothetical protein
MPNRPKVDLPHLQDGDGPLDARTPEGALPAERLADMTGSRDIEDEITEETADVAPAVDPAEEIPVPIVMSPAEIDERAQAVEAVRSNRDLEPRTEV